MAATTKKRRTLANVSAGSGAGGSSSDMVLNTSAETDLSSLHLLAGIAVKQDSRSVEAADVTLQQEQQNQGVPENANPQSDGNHRTAFVVRRPRSKRVSAFKKSCKSVADGSPDFSTAYPILRSSNNESAGKGSSDKWASNNGSTGKGSSGKRASNDGSAREGLSKKQASGTGCSGVPMTVIPAVIMHSNATTTRKHHAGVDSETAASPIHGLPAEKGNVSVLETMPKMKPAPPARIKNTKKTKGAASSPPARSKNTKKTKGTASSPPARTKKTKKTKGTVKVGSRRTQKIEADPATILLKEKLMGISFYKRIGKWTANIWMSSKKKQPYLGSYFTATEAARAYDKAWLKFRAKNGRLNYPCSDYVNDVKQMKGRTNRAYVGFLQNAAKRATKLEVAKGIHICPDGWYEVRLRDVMIVGKKKPWWRFLGRFESLQDAQRCLEVEGRETTN